MNDRSDDNLIASLNDGYSRPDDGYSRPDDGYSTPDDGHSTPDDDHFRRNRSRSRINAARVPLQRDGSRSGGRQRDASQRSRRRRGRRRQRSRVHHNESWYFPNEQAEEANLMSIESRENIVEANNSWLLELENDGQTVQPVSPLAQGGRTHTISWRDNTRTVTLPTGTNARAHSNITNERQEAVMQSARVPNGSHPDVNFNLAQRLQDRNRAIQQLNDAASQIQLAAAAAAASYAQLVASQQNRESSSQQHVGVQSLSTWNTRIQHGESWLNASVSDTHQQPFPGRRQPPAVEQQLTLVENRVAARASRPTPQANTPVPQRSVNDNERQLEDGGVATDRAANMDDDERQREVASVITTMPNSSYSSVEDVPHPDRQVSEGSDDNPYSRYDAAFSRQEARNVWRQRRRHRRDRQERREMEERIQQRRRQQAVNSFYNPTTSDGSITNLIAPLIPLPTTSSIPSNAQPAILFPSLPTPPLPTLHPPPQARLNHPPLHNPSLVNPSIPAPLPLPPPHWQPAPSLDNEWLDAPNHMSIAPAALQITRGASVEAEDDNSDEDAVDDPTDNTDMSEYMLRSYQDPAEGNSRLGEFLRRITARGRVVVSRVRTRITKQYFRRGDFQIALADFRSLHPEHARQVSGVGFTGTINNMYRLTVKQNSTFGRPTFEIRPMNKKVRRKKVHICYKIRYFGSRRNWNGRGRSRNVIPA